jgi:uncharacterized protein YceH (UPF0502 family)
MSYSSVSDFNPERKPRNLPKRELDPVELRILGSLLEKQMSTPEYYPLTLNALVAACNQKSNREPVMELGEAEVLRALDRLQDEKLVWKVMGGRAMRYDHNLDLQWQLDRRSKALLTLLFLRGMQTAGELRGRSDRLHAFESVAEVEETLQRMSELAREMPRRPGQKESRWAHLLGGAPTVVIEDEAPAATSEPLSVRVARIEERMAALEAELRELKGKLGE